jgi:hypothetical protein
MGHPAKRYCGVNHRVRAYKARQDGPKPIVSHVVINEGRLASGHIGILNFNRPDKRTKSGFAVDYLWNDLIDTKAIGPGPGRFEVTVKFWPEKVRGAVVAG